SFREKCCVETSTAKREAFSPAARGTTRTSKSWACTGTSSIWCGCSSLPFSIFGEGTMAQAAVAHVEGQQHPIKLYLVVWGWLFVLSTCSYLVDYFGIHGYLRWSLILLFMILKAGLIVAVFMHMAWERLALMYAILVPPVLVLVFVSIMVFESNYTLFTRILFFAASTYQSMLHSYS